jgi:hypothetical protein
LSPSPGAFKKRFAKPPPPPKAPVGAEFPEDSKGGRSTSEVLEKVLGRAVFLSLSGRVSSLGGLDGARGSHIH